MSHTQLSSPIRANARCAIRICLLLAIAAGPAFALNANDRWYSESYRNAPGLPTGVINAIAQDVDGYLWLGTSSGLVRFDGSRFVLWGSRGESPLPSRDVMSLLSTRAGHIWVGYTSGGVSLITGRAAVHYSTHDGLPGGFVIALLETRDGAIWMGGRSGVARFSEGRWEQVTPALGLPPTTAYSLHEDRSGTLWVGTTAGIYRRRADQVRFERFSADLARGFSEDESGAVWVTDPTRAARPLLENVPAHGISAIGLTLHHDRLGGVWVGTMGQGLLRIPPSETERPVVQRFSDLDDVNDVVLAIVGDSERNIWVATRSGLRRFFEHDVTMVTRRSGLLNNTVRSLETTNDGQVWVGTSDGLDRFGPGERPEANAQYKLPRLHITALHSDRAGRLWVGTDTSVGLFADGRFTGVHLLPDPPPGRVFSMATDPDGGLWLCRFSEVALSRWKDGLLTSFDEHEAVGGQQCSEVLSDAKGRVWIGFGDGHIAKYDHGSFSTYSTREGLPGGEISDLLEDGDGTVWALTRNGLAWWNGERFTSVTQHHGLPETDLRGMVDDGHGGLWAMVAAGIIRFDRRNLQAAATDHRYRVNYTVYDRSDGVLESPTRYGTPVATRGGDGKLWFQTVSGVAVVDPAELMEPRSVRVRAVIELLAIDARPIWPLPADLRLESGARNIQIDYGAVSLSAASKVSFEYLLEGFDANWTRAGDRRQVFYAQLPPGSYRFRVRAHLSGVSHSETSLAFTVEPPFYQRAWFRALSVVTSLLTVLGVTQLRVRAVRRRFALVLAERGRIGRELHDTLLQSLAGLALQLEGLARSPGAERAGLTGELRHLRREAQENVRTAREAIWDLRPRQGEFSLVLALEAYSRTASGHEVGRCLVRVSGEPQALPVEKDWELYMIAEEAIRNAIQHGRAGRVTVEVHYHPTLVAMRITDDGSGFTEDVRTAAATSGHVGVVGMQERASRIGAEFELDSRAGGPTTVAVRVPRSERAVAS
ncbi:MAG: two-component regulator propeller domain-containing protein [Vicinamibacterales bacterium]